MKDEARRTAAARREAVHLQHGADGAVSLRGHAMPVLRHKTGPGSVVAGYWPMRSEMDPRPLMVALASEHRVLCLPVVTGLSEPLIFRQWRPDDVLEKASFGTSIPPADAEQLTPDVILVPMLAFDRQYRRLGYGRGYYDLTLQRLRAVKKLSAYGIAFAAQEMKEVPADPWDQPLDGVFTEQGFI